MTQKPEIDLRSEEVKEILGTPPNWMVRWGTTSVFIIIIILSCLAYYIKYPEKIIGKATLITPNMPVDVVMRDEGYIDDFFVGDGELVNQGENIGVLKNDLDYVNFLDLKGEIASLEDLTSELIHTYTPRTDLMLGPLENDYLALLRILEKYRKSTKSRSSLGRIGELKSLKRKYLEEKRIWKSRLNDKAEKLRQNEDYLSILEQKLRNKEGNNIGSKMREAYLLGQKLQEEINDTESKISAIRREVRKLDIDVNAEKENKKDGDQLAWETFLDELRTMRNRLELWEQEHLIRAPISGKVSNYSKSWVSKKLHQKGEAIFAIIPQEKHNNQVPVIEVVVEEDGYGKVERGQEVNIKFNSYPFRDYGVVKGIVDNKAQLQRDRKYVLEVALLDTSGLNTTFGIALEPQPHMSGEAEILTEERRFIEHIFEHFRSFFK